MYVCIQYKKEVPSVQVKNKPRVKDQYMHLLLAHQFTWLQTIKQ